MVQLVKACKDMRQRNQTQGASLSLCRCLAELGSAPPDMNVSFAIEFNAHRILL